MNSNMSGLETGQRSIAKLFLRVMGCTSGGYSSGCAEAFVYRMLESSCRSPGLDGGMNLRFCGKPSIQFSGGSLLPGSVNNGF